jgi:hypothetical protein
VATEADLEFVRALAASGVQVPPELVGVCDRY